MAWRGFSADKPGVGQLVLRRRCVVFLGSSSNDLLPQSCRVAGVFGFGHSNRIIVILIDTDHPEPFSREPLSLGASLTRSLSPSPPSLVITHHTHTHTHARTHAHWHTHTHTHIHIHTHTLTHTHSRTHARTHARTHTHTHTHTHAHSHTRTHTHTHTH